MYTEGNELSEIGEHVSIAKRFQDGDGAVGRDALSDAVEGCGHARFAKADAGLILHQQLLLERAHRVLIVVPESLLHQWLVEMLRRFNLHFALFASQTGQNTAELSDTVNKDISWAMAIAGKEEKIESFIDRYNCSGANLNCALGGYH